MNNKLLGKLAGIFGYKLIEKNLLKNQRALKNKYFNIDLILNHLFTNHNIKNIIQIGANDGKRFDPIHKFLQKEKTNALFVEPIKEHFEKLKKNYSNKKNFIFENSAISDVEGFFNIFKVNEENLKFYDDHVAGISSFNRDHLIKHKVEKKHISEEKIKCISIKTLIEKYSINNIDLLFIDVEGHEGIIINDFFKSTNFRPVIIFEYIHVSNEIFLKVLDNLKTNNYFYSDFGENLVCFPSEKEFFFKLSSS